MRIVVLALTVSLLIACAAEPQSPGDIRRIVTIEDGDGDVRVLADDAGTNVVELNGSRIVRLWETTDMPVPLVVDSDIGATAGNAYREGFVGSSFYIAEIPAGSDLSNIPMHKQESLDYIAVLDGEIVLVLPEERLRMKRGDLLVQAGNMHSWVNDSEGTCRLLVVVLTGTRPTG
ncbi:MAG: cupin domain-containing protein [Woeseiaceae bacterium]